MNAFVAALAALSREVGALTARFGRRVDVARLGVVDRAGHLPLGAAGDAVSPNGSCRLFRAADGWMALNLARQEDRALVAAWLECDPSGDAWTQAAAHAPGRDCATLVARAALLGLPASKVAEVSDIVAATPTGRGATAAITRAARVVDLSALWAGPLCGAILAAAGAEVVRVESPHRPDPTRLATPRFHRRLNGGKTAMSLDLTDADGRRRLIDTILDADVVITSARRRGLASLGLDPEAMVAMRPGLVWVAVSGYGLSGSGAGRVAFGDDAAAAGGMVAWTDGGEPRFIGDAAADPLAGLEAAIAALRALDRGGGVLIDVAMARAAARAAQTRR